MSTQIADDSAGGDSAGGGSAGGGSASGGSASGGSRVPQTDASVMDAATVGARQQLLSCLLQSPIPPGELIRNLGLYLLPMDVKRLLFFAELYQQIVSVPGVIMEFGTRWGQTMAILQSLRAILEPYHHRRLIIGFDTFTGFPEVAPEDGSAAAAQTGAYGVTAGYEHYLDNLLALRELQSPLPQVRKYRIIRGDAPAELQRYLAQHPETIVAMAYFDMDLYQPTVDCLRLIRDRLPQGAVVGFDELNHAAFPGETTAVREVLGLPHLRLRRSPWSADESYFVTERP